MSENNEDNESENTNSNEEIPVKAKPTLFRNYISFVGFAIAVSAFTSFALLFTIELFGSTENPYADLVIFIFIPSIMMAGLFLAVVGALLERRRRLKNKDAELKAYPVIDLNDSRRRRTLIAAISFGLIFLFMTAFGSYRAYEYTESVTFCGQACHEVMRPEYIAYSASPHANIRCVACHVGSGADAYLEAKFSGMRQLYGVATGDFNRPIHTPVHNMRSATETCSNCHWPEKFHGEKLKVFNHYGYDENNTLNQTKLSINVGGGSDSGGQIGGIHWHMNVANEITFVSADERRQEIPWVRMKTADGTVTEFTARNSSMTAAQIESASKRTMDCIDCHNRPAHIFLSPNNAVDRSLESGKLDVTLPFIKSQAVETLTKEYTTTDEALATIRTDLDAYYRTAHAAVYNERRASVDYAIQEVQRIYGTYFFPEMKTNWSSHPDNIGHFNAQGCFRCHDGQHVSPEGKVIRNDCNICHVTMEQTFGGKRLEITDGKFKHPLDIADRNTYQCAACHKADRSFKHPLNLGDISKFQCADCHSGTYDKVKY